MSGATLDTILKRAGHVIVPGAFDALSARLAARAGAELIYMTGFGVAGASFGVPDIGLVSGAAEMVERVRVLAAACSRAPLIADGDNGHGGPLNAAQLARAYEKVGAACTRRLQDVYTALLSNDRPSVDASRARLGEYNEIVGLPDYLAKAKTYSENQN